MDITTKTINTIRCLCADIVQKANSGHPGMPLGCAPMGYVLFKKILKCNPNNPSWFNRDRFVLSNGHGCALLYALLHLSGYTRPTLIDLENFRQLDSVTAGHPESTHLPGVEVTTGPLGQGIANAVGFAMAERHLAATFNKPDFNVISNFSYVFCGDGCLQEGVSGEASSLAGHLKLGKLIVIYDDNDIQIDGGTNLAFTEDVKLRYEGYGWEVLVVEDGNENIADIESAILKAQTSDKPTLIKVKTAIGFGSTKEGSEKAHGSPLGEDNVKLLKEKLGFDPNQHFVIEKDVMEHMNEMLSAGQKTESEWNALMKKYKASFTDLAAQLERRMTDELPKNWNKSLPTFTPADKAEATRSSSGKVLNLLAEIIPDLIGGSADLTPSNKTWLNCSTNFQHDTPTGRYLRFGVREHAMAAICNGLTAYGGLIPFCASFLNFTGYAAGAMTLSALSQSRVIYIMTHDSIFLGEDGPTHQPIAKLAFFRATPNFYVFRPADANEVVGSYEQAILLKNSPSMFSLTRQNVPVLKGSSKDKVAKGAYALEEKKNPALVLVGTGSEVSVLVHAAVTLEKEGVVTSVVSMPCMDLFEEQSDEYKTSVFPQNVPVLAMEAAASFGWHKYADDVIGIDTFGKSAPAKHLYEEFGFTSQNVLNRSKALLAKSKTK